MTVATTLGFSRMGRNRELKKALERFWSGKSDADALLDAARGLRASHWDLQRQAGLTQVPCNDFSLYDHVLDATVMVGARPQRFESAAAGLDRYFTMARGASAAGGRPETSALEMTKWFDTNYHYLVPEFDRGQEFALEADKPLNEFREAQALGFDARPVLLGPVSLLLLGKPKTDDFHPLDLLPGLLPVYEDLLRRLAAAGANWVQLDEPCLVADLSPSAQTALESSYERLAMAAGSLNLLLATYFGGLGDALPLVMALPVKAVHLDLVRGPEQLERALGLASPDQRLSLGLLNGRDVWRDDLAAALSLAERAADQLGPDRLMIAPSCSLLHVPFDLADETSLDAELKSWLAFGLQKLEDVVTIARAVREGRAAVADALEANQAALAARRASSRTRDEAVRSRLAEVSPSMLARQSAHSLRRAKQRERVPLPLLPTTTIGSFPQTDETRKARASLRSGKLQPAEYDELLKRSIADAIGWQEEVGLDVLVHGEFERNDMVEYFGENLEGFAFTSNGWVQSYGSRCVKPPIIYGDVKRKGPITVAWTNHAQSLTSRPVKGMLTGPVTILQWSFARDDQPRSETCRQIALAIRDEVADLEAAGVAIIQVDEPALREGLPLRRADRPSYLRWAVDAFRLATAGVRDDTAIHTHMCYCEFNDSVDAIAELDADVISLETSRSMMEPLKVFSRSRYPNEIGPGVYDIHSPRVPKRESVVALLERALEVFAPEQLWVNPDCGLKTRRWDEVKPSLAVMVEAARSLRDRIGAPNRT